jgi:hypothetical protein
MCGKELVGFTVMLTARAKSAGLSASSSIKRLGFVENDSEVILNQQLDC